MSSSNKGDQPNGKGNRQEEVKTVRKIVGITISAIALIILVVGISGYFYINSALKPVDPSDESTKKVTIPIGSSVSQISNILEENNIIKDGRVFRYYIKFKNESGFQAGDYQFSSSMKMDELIASLKTGKVAQDPTFTVTIPEGKTVEQIAGLYAKKMSFSKEEFLTKVNDQAYVEKLIEQYPSFLSDAILKPEVKTPLEGYLFAATYNYYEEKPSVDQVVRKMLQKSKKVIGPKLDSIKEKDMSVHEAITMASLIENEAPEPDDRKLISGVFFNRLEEDMPLQTDPTVIYAVGREKKDELHKHMDVESPYNTYKVKGLPVGPISNFAENSLEAVINPKASDNLYFIAAPDGEVYYSKSYKEHQNKVDKYLKQDS
ncbi:endolytic transglycosylase MltG [Pontibacillus salicampi]|uniref:Endolytic murein transglycosylase n=1 Tax=Pontibacillus salicampi TaxID=1449801 RepID=A0ABV6LJI1_9BACI